MSFSLIFNCAFIGMKSPSFPPSSLTLHPTPQQQNSLTNKTKLLIICNINIEEDPQKQSILLFLSSASAWQSNWSIFVLRIFFPSFKKCWCKLAQKICYFGYQSCSIWTFISQISWNITENRRLIFCLFFYGTSSNSHEKVTTCSSLTLPYTYFKLSSLWIFLNIYSLSRNISNFS